MTTDSHTRPHWGHSALLTIDMQNDFTFGKRAIPGTDAIVPVLSELVNGYRNLGLPVFHAVRCYQEDGTNAELCRRTAAGNRPGVAAPFSEGAELIEALRPISWQPHIVEPLRGKYVALGEREFFFFKERWSAFFRTELDAKLTTLKVDTIVVAGCNFPNCPTATLFDASSLDYRMVLATDAISMLDDDGLRRAEGIGALGLSSDAILDSIRKSRKV